MTAYGMIFRSVKRLPAANYRVVITCLACLAFFAGLLPIQGDAAGAPALPPLAGSWDVLKVGAGDDQQHWAYRPDAPIYKYRVLVIDKSDVIFKGPVDKECDKPLWKSSGRSDLYQWIENTYERAVKGNDVATFLQQLDLAYENQTFDMFKRFRPWLGDRSVTLLKLTCGTETSKGNANDWHKYTFIFVSSDTLLLDDGGEGLWRLQRRSIGTHVIPSYNCARATMPAEIAICHDDVLAGYDRSVAEAYRWLLYLSRDDPNRTAVTKREQTAWIAKRDVCAMNRECLIGEMSGRIMDLM